MIPLRFTAEDADRAAEVWRANCGPGAIAAMTGLTLDELRPYLGEFEAKGYTNPTLMWETLGRLGAKWRLIKPPTAWPRYGLCRVQWEGPWTAPGVPMRVRYRHTHWIGCISLRPLAASRLMDVEAGIFDINALGNGTGWCSLADWSNFLVPWLLREVAPKANGKWHLTHIVELEERSLAMRAAA